MANLECKERESSSLRVPNQVDGNRTQSHSLLVASGMIFAGVWRTFTAKILIQLGFDSPYWLTYGMFLGMTACLVVLLPSIVAETILKSKLSNDLCRSKYASLPAHEPQDYESDATINTPDEPTPFWMGISWKALTALTLATLCGLTSTVLNNMALLWLPAAVNDVLRSGSELAATALVMVCIHGQIVTPLGWLSIAISTIGLTLVSGGLFISTSGLDSNTLVGILVSVPRAATSACQNYLDQQLLQSFKLSAVAVVGLEGLIGNIFLLLAWPCIQYLGYEDVTSNMDRLVFAKSDELLLIYGAYLFTVSISNYFSVALVAASGALTKEIWRSLRPPLIWASSILIYYCGSHQLGEKWDSKEGYTRLLGILLVTVGIIGYTHQAGKLKLAATSTKSNHNRVEGILDASNCDGDVELSSK
jgi:drug/metabolite transporter (DMT)-like permease